MKLVKKKVLLRIVILVCLCAGVFIASDTSFAAGNSEDCSVDCGTNVLYCLNPETQSCRKTSSSLKCAGEGWQFCYNYPGQECTSNAQCLSTEYCSGGYCRHQ